MNDTTVMQIEENERIEKLENEFLRNIAFCEEIIVQCIQNIKDEMEAHTKIHGGSREISIAITKMDEAILWLEKHVHELERKLDNSRIPF